MIPISNQDLFLQEANRLHTHTRTHTHVYIGVDASKDGILRACKKYALEVYFEERRNAILLLLPPLLAPILLAPAFAASPTRIRIEK